MCANPTNKDIAHYELHHHNQSIFISSYVEHIMLVSHKINRAKISPHISKIAPLCIFNNLIPSLQRDFSIMMSYRVIKFS